MDLQGRVALITGGATGIGRSTALLMAQRGMRIGLIYSRSANEAADTAKAIQAAGGEGLPLQADVADEAQVKAAVARLVERWGGVDCLVASAGTTIFADYADLDAVTDEAWQRLFAVNCLGVWYASRACAPSLKEREGSIVVIASVAGQSGLGSSIPYAVTKGAAITLTKSLARSLAPRVRVNAVAPGFVDTRWHASRPGAAQAMAERMPLKRVAVADDVADAAFYLATAAAVTGQVVVVDAGMSL